MIRTVKRYPRVLIVTKSQVNDIDSVGASIRSWFKDWPRDHLAQIYSGVPLGGTAFCGTQFHLGELERRLGSVFFRLKDSPLGDAAQPYRCRGDKMSPSCLSGDLRAYCGRAGKALIESGLWELVFSPRLSSRLRAWIEGFRPEIIFVQGCDISFMRVPLAIRKTYCIPICFDIVDDWVEHLYKESMLAPLMQYLVRHTFRKLVQESALRYTIGDLMAKEYGRRYGVPFETLMQCDDAERFAAPFRERKMDLSDIEIVYSGSLALGRWKGLVQLAQAAEGLRAEGMSIKIMAYAPYVPQEAGRALENVPGLTIRNAVPDRDVPGVLMAADVLFLPESFDKDTRAYIKLSVSTKAHLYMMSGRPSLVYGPPEIGTVDYARRGGWGYVVDQDGPEYLANALRRLLKDEQVLEDIRTKAHKIATGNHEGSSVRERMRRQLLGALDSRHCRKL